jgi:hypothetical protein
MSKGSFSLSAQHRPANGLVEGSGSATGSRLGVQPQECRRRVGATLGFGRPGRRSDPQQQADHQTLPQQAAVLHGQDGRLAGADQPERLRACQKRGQGAPRTVSAGLIERLGNFPAPRDLPRLLLPDRYPSIRGEKLFHVITRFTA